MKATINEVRESFENSPFFIHLGFEITNFEEGNVQVKLPVKEYLLNANNVLHGGVHATMTDTVMGMAIRSITKTKCTTINLNISYLNSFNSGDLYATGRILKGGYKIVTAESEVVDSEGNIISKGVGTFKLIRD